MENVNPVLSGPISPALPSPYSENRSTNSRPIDPMTKRLISELGLRYPPTSRQDEEGRAGLLALLTKDVADIPVSLLDGAVKEWTRTKAFMPKASELRNLAQTLMVKANIERQHRGGDTPADRANALLEADGKPPLWKMVNGSCELVGLPPRPRKGDEKRPAGHIPLSLEEISDMASAPPGSMRAAYFEWGRREGWIVEKSQGLFADSEAARWL